jgi:hypothetical protein
MTYENHSLRCWNCKFWWPLPDEKAPDHLRQHAQRGQCRRHAPPPMAADQAWAIVTRDEWCGEHVHVGT